MAGAEGELGERGFPVLNDGLRRTLQRIFAEAAEHLVEEAGRVAQVGLAAPSSSNIDPQKHLRSIGKRHWTARPKHAVSLDGLRVVASWSHESTLRRLPGSAQGKELAAGMSMRCLREFLLEVDGSHRDIVLPRLTIDGAAALLRALAKRAKTWSLGCACEDVVDATIDHAVEHLRDDPFGVFHGAFPNSVVPELRLLVDWDAAFGIRAELYYPPDCLDPERFDLEAFLAFMAELVDASGTADLFLAYEGSIGRESAPTAAFFDKRGLDEWRRSGVVRTRRPLA